MYLRALFCHFFYCLFVFLFFSFFFFFNDTATTEIYTLSLHDALPISLEPDSASRRVERRRRVLRSERNNPALASRRSGTDRKSTRLNSSHQIISYAVFCLKKKKKNINSIMVKVELI